jgi:inward rectifier potassium channel
MIFKGQRTEDPGIGTSFERPVDRLMGPDGSFRVQRIGERGGLREGFVALVTMGTLRLVVTFLLGYVGMNLLFASLYMLLGVEHIGNADTGSLWGRWLSALGMSVQTLTTVGYGSLYPVGAAAWAIAAVEGVFGILGFSLVSAVIYARFARPKASMVYGEQALIAPFKDGWSLQVRVANRRSTLLIEVEARILLVMADVDDQGERLNYFNLPLQIDRVTFLPLSWTLVHPITPESPLAGLSMEDLRTRRAEFLVILKGTDEGYMGTVFARRSFRYDELAWGARFVRAFTVQDGTTRLDLGRLGEHQPVPAPERLPN